MNKAKSKVDQVRAIMPYLAQYNVWKAGYERRSTPNRTGADIYAEEFLSKADAQSYFALGTSCVVFNLVASEIHTSNEDATEIIYVDKKFKKLYENRGFLKNVALGPSTCSGKNREPNSKSSRKEWEEFSEDVLSKPESMDYYTFCDLGFPPFLHISRISGSDILRFYENGLLAWPDTHPLKYGLIRHMISRNLLYIMIEKLGGLRPANCNNLIHDDRWVYKNPYNMSKQMMLDTIEIFQPNHIRIDLRKKSAKRMDSQDRVMASLPLKSIKKCRITEEFANLAT